MLIPIIDLVNSFKLTLNVLRNSLNCLDEAKKGEVKLSDEEIKLITMDINRLKLITLLYVFIFKHNISLDEVLEIFGSNSFRAKNMLTFGYKSMLFAHSEKEKLLTKAFNLNEANFEDVIFFKNARQILANELDEKYIELLPLYDEVIEQVKLRKSVRTCMQKQVPTLSHA